MSERIRWEDNASPIDAIASRGYAGKLEPRSFIIYKPEDRGGQYRLLCLVGERKSLYADDPDELKATAERWLSEFISSLGAIFPPEPEPAAACSDCGADLTVAGIRYCRVDAGRRLADGVPVVYDDNPADGESPSVETDCRGSGIYDCPCEADGPDGLCACCRSGESNGSCAIPEPAKENDR